MIEFNITPPDDSLRTRVRHKIDNLTKPLHSLGRLEELAMQISLIQQTLNPELRNPCHLLFGADHGIETEGVSASPKEVTWQQMVNFSRGGGGVGMLCRQHGIKLRIIDVGVDYDLSQYSHIEIDKIRRGTRNFLHQPAMTNAEAEQCIKVGAKVVSQCHSKGSNIISIGEMGVGNTSSSSIWMHLLGNIPLERCVGFGSGLNEEGRLKKLNILHRSVERYKGNTDPWNVLCQFGGYEMVAAVGAMLKAAELHMTILIDGFIMTACLLAAQSINPSVLPYAICCHEGNEAGHTVLLHEVLHRQGLLRLGMRLGEGTGALCAFPLIETSVRMMREMTGFTDAGVTKYF